jgi:fructokinase
MQNQILMPRIGIDLGGTKIEIVVMQADGAISHRQRCATPQGDYAGSLKALANLVSTVCESENLPEQLPIGIGTPGAISLKTGLMMNCNSTCLNDQPLAEDLSKITGRAVRIANDADCFALSEASDGAAKGEASVFGVILGTGVGGGIVIHQQLHQGVNAISGEWGHNTLPIDAIELAGSTAINTKDRLCFCGRYNCVETWLAGPSFERSYAFEVGGQAGMQIEVSDIIQRVRNGEPSAVKVFNHYQHLLALALSNVINILDPAAIVLGGGLSNVTELYDSLPGLLPKYVFSDVLNTKILKAQHGDSSGVRGAAWLWSQQDVNKQIGYIS